MKNLRTVSKSDRVAIATAAATLGFPPATFGLVPGWWSATEVIPEIELEIWAPAALALTAAVLHGATLHALTFADITLTSIDHTTSTITKAGHNLKTGDGPLNFESDATYPPEIIAGKSYWWITTSSSAGHLAASFEDAMNGVVLAFTTNGSGVLKLHATADTDRVYWQPLEPVGLAGDGAVALDVQAGYRQRFAHSPCVVAYALVGTIDTGTLSAAFVPIQDAGA